jgi:hypothetical protein
MSAKRPIRTLLFLLTAACRHISDVGLLEEALLGHDDDAHAARHHEHGGDVVVE